MAFGPYVVCLRYTSLYPISCLGSGKFMDFMVNSNNATDPVHLQGLYRAFWSDSWNSLLHTFVFTSVFSTGLWAPWGQGCISFITHWQRKPIVNNCWLIITVIIVIIIKLPLTAGSFIRQRETQFSEQTYVWGGTSWSFVRGLVELRSQPFDFGICGYSDFDLAHGK